MTANAIQKNDARIPSIWRLLGLGVFLGALSYSALLLNTSSGGITVLWPSNGLLLGVLLLSPRRQWPAYVAVAFVVDASINRILSNPLPISSYLAACNIAEVMTAAFLLFKTLAPDPDLTRRRQFTNFLLYGVVLAPAVAAFLASFALQGTQARTWSHAFRLWFTADALGIAIVTPLCISFHQRKWFSGSSLPKTAGLFALLGAVTVGSFWQTRYPLLSLVLACLVLLGMQLGLAGSALGLLMVSVMGGFFTAAGRGPVAAVHLGSQAEEILTFQLFMAIAMLVLYILDLVTAESQRLQLSLQSSEARFRLLAEVSRDIIVLTDLSDERQYVSPAVAELLGWTPEELVGGNYREIVHPDDQHLLGNVLEECRIGMPAKILTYRCKKKDGSYLWMEANLRLYRNPETNEPIGYVNVVRDISRRKAAEEELQKTFRLVENLASLDGLTGIANRRRLDEVLEQEWRRATRNCCDLTVLLIDVDHFKPYNDIYGHLSGDDCLRQIAKASSLVIHRSSDLVARYGGEEFAVVLPNTPSAGAQQTAERIRGAVEALCIPHEGNSYGVVTVSVGCATVTPGGDSSFDSVMQAADAALYQAKHAGRNRIEVAGGSTLNGQIDMLRVTSARKELPFNRLSL